MRRNGTILAVVGFLVLAGASLAVVLLHDGAKPIPTDATGDTPVAGLPPPALGLAPAPTRLGPAAPGPVTPAASSTDPVLRVTIVERVLGPDGSPVGGAAVEVLIGGEVVAAQEGLTTTRQRLAVGRSRRVGSARGLSRRRACRLRT